ncbi:GPW/gp25 family protein [Rhizobacter sp. J219]|jgi:phage baseplate assembly protein W|uniref:GPW/gp25 family protein n=1 Tax=Rhizobacter sp. J219 TaxID=2898430 RepID=UPI002150A62E|nr:GPW/gp25 family protein [Rhizobacter sp. J219]MCR5882113.1 GPW/gp25 family protein [Rhizobacter sp. J219]
MTTDTQFLGTGWAFPPSFDWRSKEAVLVSQVEDIEQSLRILLGTVPGERVMQPAYGCGLKRMVFETLNDSTATEIRDIVAKAILFFEVRITLHGVDLDWSDIAEGLLRLKLDYTVRTTNTRTNMVYPFYLSEGTNLRLPE